MHEDGISADAVITDLRTQNNNLSFWKCSEKTNKEIENVVLAIASGRDKIDRIDIVLIDDMGLKNDGQTLEPSKGRTPVADLVKLHMDVNHLDYYRLGKIAFRVASAVTAKQCRRITKGQVEEILVTAITRRGVLQINNLSEKLRPKVQKLLNKNKGIPYSTNHI